MVLTTLIEKYRNGDFIQYINNVLSIITEEKATALNLSNERTALQTSINTLTAIWMPTKKSKLTAQIAELDKRRDSLFAGLKSTIDSWSKHHYITEKRNAALAIVDVIANYGKDITSIRYQQETAILNAIIEHLQNELAPQVSVLELTEWVTTLQTANSEFNTLYISRAVEVSGNKKGAVETSRTEAIQDFRVFKNVFEARATIARIDTSANLGDFTTLTEHWNSITTYFNEAVTKPTGNGDIPPIPDEDITDGTDLPANDSTS